VARALMRAAFTLTPPAKAGASALALD